MLVCSPYFFFFKMSVQMFGPFSFVVVFLLSFDNSLYIMNTNKFSGTRFANIIFKCVAYLFIFLMLSFKEKFLILMKPNISVFFCGSHFLYCIYLKLILTYGLLWLKVIFCLKKWIFSCFSTLMSKTSSFLQWFALTLIENPSTIFV